MALKILISDPNYKRSREVAEFLADKKYSISFAVNGKDCQLKLYQEEFFATILDVDTTNHSGIEVLKYLKLNKPSVKVILTFEDKKRFEALDVSKKDLKKFGANDILVRPYHLKDLAKSLEGELQFEQWRQVKKNSKNHEEEEVFGKDEDFTRIKVEDFHGGRVTIFDHYIRIAKNKYLKILYRGDAFTPSQYQKYLENDQTEYFYFKTQDRKIYINFMNSMLEKMTASKKSSPSTKVRLTKNLSEKFIEEVYASGLKPQLIEEGRSICDNVQKMVQSEPHLYKLLESFQEYDSSEYERIFLVSFFSTIICKNLEWSSERTIKLLAFGALLHDLGKLKLPPEIVLKDASKRNAKEQEMYETHPVLGTEMLQEITMVTEPVRQIVYQHHELVNGEGYPNGLSGSKIYPLAKIVSLADAFTDVLIEEQVTPLKGLNIFVPNRENLFKYDAIMIKALMMGFRKND